jgi:hypothetical protein
MKNFYSVIIAICAMFSTQAMNANNVYPSWAVVNCAYFQGTYDKSNTIEVGEDSISFASATWGTGKFSVSTGEGYLMMSSHGGAAKKYAGDIKGSEEDKSYTITIPSVMGGTTIVVNFGDFPVALNTVNTYPAKTYASCAMFQNYSPATDESVIVSANSDNASVNVSYTSGTWGKSFFSNVTVTENEDGTFTLSGKGTIAMTNPMGGTKDYAADFAATVSEAKVMTATISIPGVMDGTTIYINPADFDEVTAISNVAFENESESVLYNLQGVRVDASYKGVVIKNGKKIFNK